MMRVILLPHKTDEKVRIPSQFVVFPADFTGRREVEVH